MDEKRDAVSVSGRNRLNREDNPVMFISQMSLNRIRAGLSQQIKKCFLLIDQSHMRVHVDRKQFIFPHQVKLYLFHFKYVNSQYKNRKSAERVMHVQTKTLRPSLFWPRARAHIYRQCVGMRFNYLCLCYIYCYRR